MNRQKKLLSQTASILMCLAMAGSSIAGVMPVWATGQNADSSGIQVTKTDASSATLLATASEGSDGEDLEFGDIGYQEKYWLRNGTDMRQVEGTALVKQVMKDLFLPNVSDDVFNHLHLDIGQYDVYGEDGQSTENVIVRRNLSLDKTINDVYAYFYTFGDCDLILYDDDEQLVRVKLHWNPDSVGANIGAMEVVDGTLQEGSNYSGIKKLILNLGDGQMNPSNAVLWRNESDTVGDIFPEVTHSSLSLRGWYTESNGQGELVSSGTPVSHLSKDSSGNYVLYAYYAEPVVQVVFDASGWYEGDIEPIEVYKGKPIKETPDINFPTDFSDVAGVFRGWYTEPDGKGTRVTEDSTLNEDTTLYAHFTEDDSTYRVTFDANGGQVYGDSHKDVLQNQAIGSDIPTATRAHYVFDGWFTAASGGTKLTVTTVIDSNQTYYAHWTAEKYTLNFDVGNGHMTGSDLSTKKTYAYGETITYLPSAELAGHSFEGWYTDVNGGGRKISVGSSLNEDTNVFAYFKEVADTKTITFNPNGGTVSETSRVKEKGANIGELPTPVRTGYVFDGWFTELNGGYEVTPTYKVSENVTLYAHWTKAKNPVTSLTIADSTINVDITDQLEIRYSYAPADADNAQFYWTSSNEDVIKVGGDGRLILVSGGTAVLTIHTADNSKEASVTVNVNAPKILVTKLDWDNKNQTVSSADGLDMGYTYGPRNAENATFKFTSSDKEIIDIAEDGSSFLFGGKLGDVTLTIATADGSISDAMNVRVIDPDDDDKNPPEDIQYTVTFNTHGGKAVAPVKVKAGENVVNLPVTTKDGYTFDGWALANGTKVTGLENVSSDIVLYAQWIQDEDPDEDNITVTFESQNGVAAVKQELKPGISFASLPTPTRNGYTFMGWFTAVNGQGVKITTSTVFDEDITVYAYWVNTATAGKYTLTLDANGGLINGVSGLTVADTKLESGKGIWNSIASFVPTKPGYTFNGWTDENGVQVYDITGNAVYGTPYWKDSDTYTGKDLTVYAQWMKNATKYELRYDTRGGNDIHSVYYDDGSEVSAFVTPVRPGYIFDGWFTDATFKTPVEKLTMTQDYTIYAKWTKEETEKPLKTYTVTFDSQGGSDVESVKVKEGTVAELPTPTYEGHTFEGWFTEPEGGTCLVSLKVSANMTLYAQWTKDSEPVVKTTITFDYNDGTNATRKITATAGTELTTLPIAARHGYIFDGWFDTPENGEGEAYEIYVVGDEPATLYAHWTTDKNASDDDTVMFTLLFDSVSGSYVDPITVPDGELITALPTPVRAGYVFDGWFTDPSETGDKVDTIELHANTTLYAHWTEAADADEVWEVTLNDGVTTPHTWALNTTSAFTAFTTPVRDGYTFLGWFTAADGGEKVADSYAYAGDKDVTFYAHWEKKSAENPDDGDKPVTPPNPDEGDKPTTPENPTDKKVEYITLSEHELTRKMGEDLGLTFVYGPKNAVNAKFVWTSSNEDVMKVVTDENGGQMLEYVAAGKTTLTVSTEDGSVSDSCELTVEEGEKPSKTTYRLNVKLPDGSSVTASVKSTATLDSLFKKLGYSVAGWSVDGSDAEITGAITMKELADMVQDKLVLNVLDSDGKVLGNVEIVPDKAENTYNLTVTMNGTDKPDDGDKPNKPGDDQNNGNNDNDNDNNQNGGSDNTPNKPGDNDTNKPNDNSQDNNNQNDGSNNSDNEIRTYQLTVISVTGTTSNVKIQSNKTLAELAKALGYDNVARWSVKQANISEYGIDGSMTMAALAELIEKNGDLAIMAYDSNGELIGCAKVVADGKDSYKVQLSKDANVALRSAKEIADKDGVAGDGKGKGDNTVSKDGKPDERAPKVQTADSRTLPIYGAFGGITALLLALSAFLKKKMNRV